MAIVESNGAVGVQVAPGGPAAALIIALGRAERHVTRRLRRVLADEACGVDVWRALTLLADGGGHPMAEMADAALLPGPTLTRLVDRMAQDNLVYRRADDRDRRRILVFATERGLEIWQRIAERLEEEQETVLSGISAREAEQIVALLDQLD